MKMLYKIVCLGDGGVGKSTLTIQQYNPAIEDSYRKQTVVDGQPCILEILDTAGQEQYTDLCGRWISIGEGFLIIYSISSRSTFERIERFYNIISYHKSYVPPIILIGNKCDQHAEREVSREEGMNMAKKFKCDFIETSAKTCVNVERCFYSLVRMIRNTKCVDNKSSRRKKKQKYTIL
ncbi:putative small G-protein Ras2 [Gigaspora margarita]|uniref:Putative small G-protein Ras2 n=1 Tax=Gigaspora margarita TaxID=4874 RepID=A0A8H4AIN4_GIGMA|nr:putative small G-protein Ras2 [Gigaspora margarita]